MRKYRRGKRIYDIYYLIAIILNGGCVIHVKGAWSKTYNSAFMVGWPLRVISLFVTREIYEAIPITKPIKEKAACQQHLPL